MAAAFLELIENDGALSDWEGAPVARADLQAGLPLYLVAKEVSRGRFEQIEDFCVGRGLIFARWSGGAPESFGPERVVFDGAQLRSFAVSDDDEVVVSATMVRELGSYDAILAHLAQANFVVPPFRLVM